MPKHVIAQTGSPSNGSSLNSVEASNTTCNGGSLPTVGGAIPRIEVIEAGLPSQVEASAPSREPVANSSSNGLPKHIASPPTFSSTSSPAAPSPSRIPSRQQQPTSTQHQQSSPNSSQGHSPVGLQGAFDLKTGVSGQVGGQEELRKLESRIERFVSRSSGSECSEGSSETSGKGTASSVTSRLYNGQTASSRAKAEGKLGGGNSPPGEKGVGSTGSMLRTTLRKMTRFSIGGKKKEEDEGGESSEAEQKQSRSRNPFLGKSRVPQSQSPGPGVGRSRSFKEPQAVAGRGIPGPQARNSVYTSSLRRSKAKQAAGKEEEVADAGRPNTLGTRSGTGGMERSAMRRSVSASRGGRRDQSGQEGKLVLKSRPVQTSLTRDPASDALEPAASPGHVSFQMWLPELLGLGDDEVQTTVSEHVEPLDARKTRALTLENMKLTREVERLRGHQGEAEQLKRELTRARSKLEEEKTIRGNIQADLEQYQERVRVCMESMDSVERQFEVRDLALARLEGEKERGGEVQERLRERLSQAESMVGGQRRELERSVAAQKMLLQQVQEQEAEAGELQDFLQAEKATLQEALKEAEAEVQRLNAELSTKENAGKEMEEQAGLLVRRAEQAKQEALSARAETQGVKERAREMLLAQGAELSRASLYICSLQQRMETLLGAEGEEVSSDPPSEESSDPAARLDLAARRSSQFLVTPTEGLMDREELLSEFGKAMMVTSTGSEGLAEPSLSSLASAIQSREEAETVSHGETPPPAPPGVPGLVEQLGQVDALLAKLVASVQANTARREENIVNGNQESEIETRLREMESQLGAKDTAISEMRGKFAKNRQILTGNWEQAEAEVRRLDEIYHETVDSVIRELANAPEALVTYPGLAALATALQQARQEQSGHGSPPQENGNANLGRMSRSMGNHMGNGGMKGGHQSVMSQSQGMLLTNSNTSSGLSQSILSDPCLLKSPPPSLPSLLSSDLARQQDMNANQSL